jgi:hypothetical protein
MYVVEISFVIRFSRRETPGHGPGSWQTSLKVDHTMEARTFIKVLFVHSSKLHAALWNVVSSMPTFRCSFILHSPRFRRDTISTFEAPQMVTIIILTRDGWPATAKQTKSMEFGGLPDR